MDTAVSGVVPFASLFTPRGKAVAMLTPLPAWGRAILVVCCLSVTAISLAAEGSSPSPHRLVPPRPFCEFRRVVGQFRLPLPAQTVDATLAWSLLAGVWNPSVFLGR